MANFYGAIVAFVADAVVTVVVSMVTAPKPVEELAGLVWGVPDPNAPDPASVPKPQWWASPKLLGGVSGGIVVILSIIFI
jgi:SSS family solute:Na+ symporter